MLGKLMKYEFRATARWYLPIYAGMLLLSLLSTLLHNFDDLGPAQFGESLFYGLSLSLYVLVAMALVVVTIVLVISRFYKNLLGREGYLMFTLPVTAKQNILGKLFPAIAWLVGSTLLAMLTISFMVTGSPIEVFVAIGNWLAGINFIAITTWQEIGLGILTIVLILLSMASSILMVYLCLSIGQLANEHKLLLSVGAYMGIAAAWQIIAAIFANIAVRIESIPLWIENFARWFVGLFEGISEVGAVYLALIFFIILIFLYNWAMFAITRHLLSKKLNLA